MVAAVFTFLITMTMQLKKNRAAAQRNAANTITPDNVSTNSAVKMKHARPSPESGQAKQRCSPRGGSPQEGRPFTLNYGATESGSMDETGTNERGAIIFVDSSKSRGASLANQNKSTDDETAPLLHDEDATSTQTTGDFEFGVLSEASGIWHRDLAGRHLIRFIVLLLLLVFSSLVVSSITVDGTSNKGPSEKVATSLKPASQWMTKWLPPILFRGC